MTDETTTPDATEATAPEAPALKFGFAVFVTENGDVYVERNTAAFAIPVERQATLLEVRRYTSEILMDLQAQSAAEYVSLKMAAGAQPSA
jgi:hypothetical protein